MRNPRPGHRLRRTDIIALLAALGAAASCIVRPAGYSNGKLVVTHAVVRNLPPAEPWMMAGGTTLRCIVPPQAPQDRTLLYEAAMDVFRGAGGRRAIHRGRRGHGRRPERARRSAATLRTLVCTRGRPAARPRPRSAPRPCLTREART
ncbi:MAG: hypothetical protein JXB32_17910 [Deltaproteobacteria bacterium]|nr:hypothetical protein [Deltaproteobacteria bacterium]